MSRTILSMCIVMHLQSEQVLYHIEHVFNWHNPWRIRWVEKKAMATSKHSIAHKRMLIRDEIVCKETPASICSTVWIPHPSLPQENQPYQQWWYQPSPLTRGTALHFHTRPSLEYKLDGVAIRTLLNYAPAEARLS